MHSASRSQVKCRKQTQGVSSFGVCAAQHRWSIQSCLGACVAEQCCHQEHVAPSAQAKSSQPSHGLGPHCGGSRDQTSASCYRQVKCPLYQPRFVMAKVHAFEQLSDATGSLSKRRVPPLAQPGRSPGCKTEVELDCRSCPQGTMSAATAVI